MAKRQPPQDANRDDASTIRGLQHLSSRLSRAVAALADGDESAADDTAAVLRTLVARGRGDDAIRRAAQRFGLPEPELRASEPVVTAGPPWFAIGNIPTSDETQPVVPFTDWSLGACLAMHGLRRSAYDWGQYITDVANTDGSHFSPTIPEVLDEVRVGVAGGLGLNTFLLWNAAVGAMQSLSDVLNALDATTGKTVPPPPTTIHYVRVAKNRLGGWEFTVGPIHVDPNDEEEQVLISGINPPGI